MYKVVRGTSISNIDAVSEIENKKDDDLIMDWSNTLNLRIENLYHKDHYFSVAVKDEAGNIAVYTPIKVTVDYLPPTVLTIIPSEYGIVVYDPVSSGDLPVGQYVPGTKVTLTAFSNITSSSFKDWGGDYYGISEKTYIISVDTNKTIEPTFVDNNGILYPDKEYNIIWEYDSLNNNVNKVNIELYKDGSFSRTMASGLDYVVDNHKNLGKYSWKIPSDINVGEEYNIRIEDYNNSGNYIMVNYSNNKNFTILPIVKPNGLTPYKRIKLGENYNIELEYSGVGFTADVVLFDGEQEYITLANDIYFDSSVEKKNITWNVPTNLDVNKDDYSIRIIGSGNDSKYIDLNFPVYIVPGLYITSFNDGGTLKAGQTYDITWDTIGNVGNVILFLSRDTYYGRENIEMLMVSEEINNTGIYQWTVPENLPVLIGREWKINVLSTDEIEMLDKHNVVINDEIDGTLSIEVIINEDEFIHYLYESNPNINIGKSVLKKSISDYRNRDFDYEDTFEMLIDSELVNNASFEIRDMVFLNNHNNGFILNKNISYGNDTAYSLYNYGNKIEIDTLISNNGYDYVTVKSYEIEFLNSSKVKIISIFNHEFFNEVNDNDLRISNISSSNNNIYSNLNNNFELGLNFNQTTNNECDIEHEVRGINVSVEESHSGYVKVSVDDIVGIYRAHYIPKYQWCDDYPSGANRQKRDSIVYDLYSGNYLDSLKKDSALSSIISGWSWGLAGGVTFLSSAISIIVTINPVGIATVAGISLGFTINAILTGNKSSDMNSIKRDILDSIDNKAAGITIVLSREGYPTDDNTVNEIASILKSNPASLEGYINDLMNTPAHTLMVKVLWDDLSEVGGNVISYEVTSDPPKDGGLYLNKSRVNIKVRESQYAVLDRWGGHYTQNGGDEITFYIEKNMSILLIVKPLKFFSVGVSANNEEAIVNITPLSTYGYRYGDSITISTSRIDLLNGDKLDIDYWMDQDEKRFKGSTYSFNYSVTKNNHFRAVFHDNPYYNVSSTINHQCYNDSNGNGIYGDYGDLLADVGSISGFGSYEYGSNVDITFNKTNSGIYVVTLDSMVISSNGSTHNTNSSSYSFDIYGNTQVTANVSCVKKGGGGDTTIDPKGSLFDFLEGSIDD